MRAQLRRWIGEDDSPLEDRIKRMAFTMTMLIVILLVGVMLTLTLLDIPSSQKKSNLSNVSFIGEVLSADIKNQVNHVRQLSQSSLVWTALTDSAGRDAYLRPFMQDQAKSSGNIPMQLLDYRGRPVLGGLPAAMDASQLSDMAGKVIAEKKPHFVVTANQGQPRLLALFPVIFPYTQESIGVLLGEINLSELFQRRSAGLTRDLGLEMLHQEHTIATHAGLANSVYYPARYDLALDDGMEGGALALKLYATSNPWLFPILERVLVSALLAALLGAFVWRMAGAIAHRLSQRLTHLAEACISLSEGRAATIPEDPARDEIGVLSRTLHQAIDSYEQINAHLEDLVEKKIRKLSESEARFRSFFENNSSVMLLIEPETGKLIDANMAAANYYQLPRERLTGMNLDDFKVEPGGGIDDVMHQALQEAQDLSTSRQRLSSGEIRDVEIYSTPIVSGGRRLLFSIIHDITARRQLEVQVRQLAFYDALTQLPNRRLLYDRLEQATSANRRRNLYGALMFLDLDNFKPLNDAHGHAVGDLLLRQVAERLKLCVREMDTVARLGGDEFVVMLCELSMEKAESIAEARIVAEKIRHSLAEPYVLAIHTPGQADVIVEHHCTASIGVVVFDSHETSEDEILKQADIAMYQAKDAGRNAIRFYGMSD
ncbi:MAG TPA: sensor domain-containing diguanylate cyclase [Gallionellaceae bacterium]